MIAAFITIVGVIVIVVGVANALIVLIQLGAAFVIMADRARGQDARNLWRRVADAAPSVAIVVPAYNEAATIVESLSSLLALEYPTFELIVVNDGSRDATLEVLTRAFDLVPAAMELDERFAHKPVKAIFRSRSHPQIMVVDKVNGRKADASNAGIAAASAELICIVDADSLLERDALLRTVEPFIDDPRTVAAGGNIRIANGLRVDRGFVVDIATPSNFLALFQSVEYLRSFLTARTALSGVNALTIISGGFGVFRRDVLVEVGGYSPHAIGEDFDLVVKIHKRLTALGRDYRIVFAPEPVCWTEVPETFSALRSQRTRWQRGALQTLHEHADIFCHARNWRVSVMGLGQMLITDVIGPWVESAGYIVIPLATAFGLLNVAYFWAFAGLSFGFGIFQSVAAIGVEEINFHRYPKARHLAMLLLAAVVENFGYRQLCNVWRMQGTLDYLRGKHEWGAMTRKGFTRAEPQQDGMK